MELAIGTSITQGRLAAAHPGCLRLADNHDHSDSDNLAGKTKENVTV